MARPENTVLTIEPNTELKFDGPFTLPALSLIKLTNVTEKKVHFKLKTTAPKKYCVRPNSGVLQPQKKQEVQVVLQPFNFNPNEKNKHKFMVQFVIEPEGDRAMTTEEMWKSIAPDKIMNYKLRCVFEQPALPGNDIQDPASTENVVSVADQKIKKIVETQSKLVGNGGELQKVAAEVKQLKDEEVKLRQENIGLKEEISRLRQKSGQDSDHHVYSPPAFQIGKTQDGPTPPLAYMIVTLFIAIAGFLLGKFFN